MNTQNHMKDTNVVGRWATVLALQKKRGIQGRTIAWGPPPLHSHMLLDMMLHLRRTLCRVRIADFRGLV